MGYDVFNALDLMENKLFLENLKFGIGDGNLQYYLYNWRCQKMEPNQVSKIPDLMKIVFMKVLLNFHVENVYHTHNLT